MHYLFLQILNAVQLHDDYFIQKNDGIGIVGLSYLQNITSAIRLLVYRMSTDCVDEYVRLGETQLLM